VFSRRILLLLLTAAELGCRQKAIGPKPRYAVVRFENLSADPALDWAGRAASEMLPVMLSGAMDGPVLPSTAIFRQSLALGGRPPAAPGLSAERSEALLAGATRLITGYLSSSNGKVRISAVVENLSTGKILRTVTAEGASPLQAVEALTRVLAPSAGQYVTSHADAIRLYSSALDRDAGEIDRLGENLHQALAADPSFGPAWLALVQTYLFKRDRPGAEQTITEARQNKLDPGSIATLEEQTAELQDDKPAIFAAQRKLVSLYPADIGQLRGLAERETAEGQFAAAADDWKKLSEALPDDPATWNSLGYTRSFGGDYAGAMQALQTYEKLLPNDPNVHDSMGDVAYSFGRFTEAAANYAQAYAKDPNFLRGGDLYKAAWAKFRAGDKAGADASFAQFKGARAKLNDATVPISEADWLYRTGRSKEAVALLRATVAKEDSSPQLSMVSRGQLAIWDAFAGDRVQANADAEAAGLPTNAPLAVMRFAVLPSASLAEWQARAEKMAPQIRQAALAYALLLDGKPKDALPYWQEIVKVTPATDFFSRAILAALEGKKAGRPIVPDPTTVNQFNALLHQLGVE
jgi:Tfp pilus assembly protein PilF